MQNEFMSFIFSERVILGVDPGNTERGWEYILDRMLTYSHTLRGDLILSNSPTTMTVCLSVCLQSQISYSWDGLLKLKFKTEINNL